MRHVNVADVVLCAVAPLRADDHCIGHSHAGAVQADGRTFDPKTGRDTRQYALQAWLQYLDQVVNVPREVLVEGFYAGTAMLPQEYLNSRIAGLGTKFADWAAANTPDCQ